MTLNNQDPSPAVPVLSDALATVGQLRAAVAQLDNLPDDLPIRAVYDYFDHEAVGVLRLGTTPGPTPDGSTALIVEVQPF